MAVGRPVPSAAVDVVRTADNEGLDQSVTYLTGLGHRHITYVDGGRGAIPTLRRRGYQQAMRPTAWPTRSKLSGAAIPKAPALRRQARPRAGLTPTAMLTFNDRCAIGLIDALVRARVDIPGAISVVGYDDSAIARLAHINLTTVSQNTHQLTDHAIAALIERLDDGRTEQREVVVRPELKVRETTGPPPGRPS